MAGLPCLLDLLPVSVRHILAISVRFQWVCSMSPKGWSLLISSNSFLGNVNNAVSIKSKSRTKDCGPRTGYKSETKVSEGLRTAGWV